MECRADLNHRYGNYSIFYCMIFQSKVADSQTFIMAEMDSTSGHDRQKGFAHPKKLSTRVDLTPMVDLGFLLITFFIFTYHISSPKVMGLKMPADKGDSSTIGESNALTIVTSDNEKVFYYHGSLQPAMQNNRYGYTNYSVLNGIGEIIRAKQIALEKLRPGSRNELMILIKSAVNTRYENVVNLLDEMVINDVKRYAIMDLLASEQIAMNSLR